MTDNVLEHPDVVVAIAKLQGKYDKRVAELAEQNTSLASKLDEFTSAVDSVEIADDDDNKPKSMSALAALKAKAAASKAAAAATAKQAESRELAKHKAATDLFIKYEHRGVKLQDLLGMSDEGEMREHIITVLETASTQNTAASRVSGNSAADLANRAKGTKADFLDEVKDLFEEGKREGRTIFKTQSFD